MASVGNFAVESQAATWTWQENKTLETAILAFPDDIPNRWEKIAIAIPGKSAKQIEEHYKELVDDVMAIESGLYDELIDEMYFSETQKAEEVKSSVGVQEMGGMTRRGTPWTQDEHRLFLMGLNKYGKGDWKSISRNFVKTRTPTQVASHAQKYYIYLNKTGNKRRRSIHNTVLDENNSNNNPDVESDLGHPTNTTQPSI